MTFLYPAPVDHRAGAVRPTRCFRWFPDTLGVDSRSFKQIRMKKTVNVCAAGKDTVPILHEMHGFKLSRRRMVCSTFGRTWCGF